MGLLVTLQAAQMKIFHIFIFLIVSCPISLVQAAPRAPVAATNITQNILIAGRLRLQSQRLAKLWLQVGLGINAGAANGLLIKGMTQFDQGLSELERYAVSEKTRKTLHRVNKLWEEYRIALNFPYNRNNLLVVSYLSDDLMLATGKLTMQIEEVADGGSGRLLDLSLRQSMLAQRLARLYLMAQAGDTSQGRLVDIEQARKEFSTALEELSGAPGNSPANREALELARMQWLFFDRAVSDMQKGAESHPLHVATTSERILEVLDVVSLEYAQNRVVSLPSAPARRSVENRADSARS